jgi:hypothetical protein
MPSQTGACVSGSCCSQSVPGSTPSQHNVPHARVPACFSACSSPTLTPVTLPTTSHPPVFQALKHSLWQILPSGQIVSGLHTVDALRALAQAGSNLLAQGAVAAKARPEPAALTASVAHIVGATTDINICSCSSSSSRVRWRSPIDRCMTGSSLTCICTIYPPPRSLIHVTLKAYFPNDEISPFSPPPQPPPKSLQPLTHGKAS